MGGADTCIVSPEDMKKLENDHGKYNYINFFIKNLVGYLSF